MSSPRFAAAAVLLLGLIALPATADDPPAAGGAPPKVDSATRGGPRIERAKELVRTLEEALEIAKKASPVDEGLVARLDQAVVSCRVLAKPIQLADLSDDERKSILEEAMRQPKRGAAPQGGDWAAARDRMFSKAFDDADLSEEEEVEARGIVDAWWTEALAAFGDSKKASDLKRDRDDKLTKAPGRKKAMKVINNLNSLAGPPRR